MPMNKTMNIFEPESKIKTQKPHLVSPLAMRMRPRSLDEFIGQEHIIGPGSILRKAIEANRLFSSIILWGPPGIGKTTLATIIAQSAKAHFETISAVTAGIADIRLLITRARQYVNIDQKTIVLVDEIHRFNKAQQDALLPHVEDGTIVLIGATTENPSFEVIPALVSRSRVFNLKPVTIENLMILMQRALTDTERGYGAMNIQASQEALAHIANLAGGDVRSALNALELAVESATLSPENTIQLDLNNAEEAMQQRTLRYDKGGREHYDTISAFIKSVRGSDPDAALYWLAKMVYAGEDPKFIMRRLLVLASEDIGLADPLGIVVASSCARALEWCGLPEAQYHLAQATTYLATAAKSNSLGGYFKALEIVQQEGKTEVPAHIKDVACPIKHPEIAKKQNHPYKYPHDYPGHWVEQQYLPDGLEETSFYTPSDQGHEKKIAERLKIWRPEAI